jgi:hypothetical protein
VSDDRLPDHEPLLLRIPPTSPWFAPPDRITSANFRLRKGHSGLSVYRERIASAGDVLTEPNVPAGCFLVTATVGEVRALANAKGERLNLDVIAVADENDPGHAEIRGRFSDSVAQALKRLFRRA